MVKIFAFDEDILDALVASLSPERIATYMAAAGGDREKVMRLYTWNTAVSAAFYGPLQGLEVALRNAMHRSLAAHYGPGLVRQPGLPVRRRDPAPHRQRQGHTPEGRPYGRSAA